VELVQGKLRRTRGPHFAACGGRAVAILANVCDAGSRGRARCVLPAEDRELEGSRVAGTCGREIDRCIAFKAAKDAEIAAALQAMR